MKNPNGPYPGRQLFVGLTSNGLPAFIYLVTGRSPASRERTAVMKDNTVVVGPVGNAPYDPLRHYNCLKHDPQSGLAAVSNGIQTEALYETYRLLFNVGAAPAPDFAEKIMEGAGAEPDPPLNTPRIGAIITKMASEPVFIVAIKRIDMPAKAFAVKGERGRLGGVSTYQGIMDTPGAFEIGKGLAVLPVNGNSAAQLAMHLYEISAADYKGDDIRVCAVGGVLKDGTWDVAVVNRQK